MPQPASWDQWSISRNAFVAATADWPDEELHSVARYTHRGASTDLIRHQAAIMDAPTAASSSLTALQQCS